MVWGRIDRFLVKIPSMKIWLEEKSTPTHHIIYLSKEGRLDGELLGDYDDDQLRHYFTGLNPGIDAEKNLKLLHYFGYLHIFAKKEK